MLVVNFNKHLDDTRMRMLMDDVGPDACVTTIACDFNWNLPLRPQVRWVKEKLYVLIQHHSARRVDAIVPPIGPQETMIVMALIRQHQRLWPRLIYFLDDKVHSIPMDAWS